MNLSLGQIKLFIILPAFLIVIVIAIVFSILTKARTERLLKLLDIKEKKEYDLIPVLGWGLRTDYKGNYRNKKLLIKVPRSPLEGFDIIPCSLIKIFINDKKA